MAVRAGHGRGGRLAGVLASAFALALGFFALLSHASSHGPSVISLIDLPHVGPTVSAPSASVAAAAQPTTPADGEFYLGVSSDPDTLAAYNQVSGVERDSILGGYVLHGGQLMSIVKHSKAMPGAIPLISWGVDLTHDAVLAGTDDAYIRAQAQALAAYGKPVFVRLDWEMNGDWYPQWDGTGVSPIVYVESWRYIREYFWLEHAYNVSFVWCPNVGDPVGSAAYDWYPGDSYVDWVAVDAYPQSNLAGKGSLTGPDGLPAMAEQAAAHGKPLMLAEWAPSSPAPDVADPFDEVFRWAANYPGTVKALVYFNYGSSRVDHFLIDHPVGAAEYRSLIARNRDRIVGARIAPGG